MPILAVRDGLRLHVQQSGAGPDVVLIHGVTGDLSIWFLCKAMQELGKTHRVTAYDLATATAGPALAIGGDVPQRARGRDQRGSHIRCDSCR